MENSKTTLNKPLSRALLIDAAAWVARMNGPLRTEATEQGFAQWLKDDPLHRDAFVEVTRDWERIEEHKHHAHVVISAVPEPSPALESQRHHRKGPVFAMAAMLGVAVIGGWQYFGRPDGVTTAIGEQRILTLEDGTKVFLNTATHIVVEYDKQQRTVRLEAGEAFFEVAQQADRPFVVAAGGQRVTALGTAFLVRREEDRLAVTLMDGKVSVAAPREGRAPTVLAPGQRVTFEAEVAEPALDHPSLPKLVAWQQGQVHIDDWPLADAVAEMNRYSPIKLVIENPQTAEMPLSGVFTAGQSMSFARAVAESYQLEVIDRGSTIVLSGTAHRLLPAD
jgi:transmembrane sensor